MTIPESQFIPVYKNNGSIFYSNEMQLSVSNTVNDNSKIIVIDSQHFDILDILHSLDVIDSLDIMNRLETIIYIQNRFMTIVWCQPAGAAGLLRQMVVKWTVPH